MMLAAATVLAAAQSFGPPGPNHGCPLEGGLTIVDETHGAMNPTVQISGDRSELTMRLLIGGLECTAVYSSRNAGGIADAYHFVSMYDRTSHGPAACHQFYNECDEVCMSSYHVSVSPDRAAFGIEIESAANVPPGCTCYEGEGAMDRSCPADAAETTTTTTTTTTTSAPASGGEGPRPRINEQRPQPDDEAVRNAWNARPKVGPTPDKEAVRHAWNNPGNGINANKINDWDTDDIVWARQRHVGGGESRSGSPDGPPAVADRLAVNTNQFGRTFHDRTQPPAVHPPHRTGDGAVGIKVGDLDFPGLANVAAGKPGAEDAKAPKPLSYDQYDDSWNGGAGPSTVVLRGRVIDISDGEERIDAVVDGALAHAIPRLGAALRELIISGILGDRPAAVAKEAGIGN